MVIVSVPSRGLSLINYRNEADEIYDHIAVSVPSRGLSLINTWFHVQLNQSERVSVPSRGLSLINAGAGEFLRATPSGFPSPLGD